jgi:outer membrane protein assembly factor BamB
MLWSFEGLGRGFASVSVVEGTIYTTGMIEKTGYLFAIDDNGNLKWKTEYGPEWTGSYPGTRTTPTVDGDRLYIMSGQGRIACFEREEGDLVWQVDTLDKFQGKNIKWGIAESVLIDGDKVFCTPGGKDATIVALNKHTGQTIWTTKGLSNLSAYCSPILYETPKKRLLFTMVRKLIVCVDSENGKVLWTIPHSSSLLSRSSVFYQSRNRRDHG